jgi:hypothetical protein
VGEDSDLVRPDTVESIDTIMIFELGTNAVAAIAW